MGNFVVLEMRRSGQAPHAQLELRPNFAVAAFTDLAKGWQPSIAEPIIHGMCMAGLALTPVGAPRINRHLRG